jgi:hypothetical protein
MATTAAQKQLTAWKNKHADELATEREASSSTILALQKEKTTFEAFIREMSRQLLGEFSCLSLPHFFVDNLGWGKLSGGQSPSVASPLGRVVPKRGESAWADSP